SAVLRCFPEGSLPTSVEGKASFVRGSNQLDSLYRRSGKAVRQRGSPLVDSCCFGKVAKGVVAAGEHGAARHRIGDLPPLHRPRRRLFPHPDSTTKLATTEGHVQGAVSDPREQIVSGPCPWRGQPSIKVPVLDVDPGNLTTLRAVEQHSRIVRIRCLSS